MPSDVAVLDMLPLDTAVDDCAADAEADGDTLADTHSDESDDAPTVTTAEPESVALGTELSDAEAVALCDAETLVELA